MKPTGWPRRSRRWLPALGLAAAALLAALVAALGAALLPGLPAPGAGGAAPPAEPVGAAETGAGAGAAAGEGAGPEGITTPEGPAAAEAVARLFLDRLGNGDAAGAAALVAPGGPPPDRLAGLAQQRPRAQRGGALPGPGPAVDVLFWARYDRTGTPVEGQFRVQVAPAGEGWQVHGVEGPIAPREGWATFQFPTTDLAGQAVAVQGPAVLWTGRRPDAALAATLEAVRARVAGRVQVVLVLDLGAPGSFDRYARNGGWTGPVWRVRGRLEELAVPARWPYLGGAGLLVDAAGRVVASLGALDPARYGLPDSEAAAAAEAALRAYGLIP